MKHTTTGLVWLVTTLGASCAFGQLQTPVAPAKAAPAKAAATTQGAAKGASAFPVKPIRMLIPFSVGGGTDIIARALADNLSSSLGQPINVDNRPGAGGAIAAESVVRAAPDGYMLIMVSGSYPSTAAMYKLNFDPLNDITPISLIGTTAFLAAVHPSLPVKNVEQLIALGRETPGKLSYASTAIGGVTHLATTLFEQTAKMKMTHIPYKGTGAAMKDVTEGKVQVIFGSATPMVPVVKKGSLRGLAVTSLERMPILPDVPTVAETLPGFEVTHWYGLWGPKGLPAPVVARLNAAVDKALKDDAIREKLSSDGLVSVGGAPSAMMILLKRDYEKWTKVVRAMDAGT